MEKDLRDARFGIVGINYAPEHTGIGPYTTQLAEYLAARGASVTVFTGVPHYPSWTVGPKYRYRLHREERLRGVKVHRLRHYVPRRQTAGRRALYEATFGAQVWVRYPARKAPQAIVAVVPSLLGAVSAVAFARRRNVPLLLWVQDLMGPASVQSGISGGGKYAVAVRCLERYALRGAHDVAIVSESFRSYVLSAGVDRDHVHHVPNWTHVATPKRAVAVVRAEMGWLPGEKILLHSGNMGLKQGLENLIEVARRAPAPWRVVLMGDGSQNSSLQKLAQNVPVTFLPPSPSEKFTEILAAADVLVVNERATAADMSLPSKLTSYFSVGRPVLAAVPLHGGTAAEVRQAGAGLVVPPEDPESFVRALDVLVADASLRERLGTAGKNYATSQLCSEIALDSLAALLKTIRVQSPSS